MVQWTAEKDQQILKGIFTFCDIKSSSELLKFLADLIGEDCSTKAISHRLAKLRGPGKMTKTPSSATSTPSKTAATPRKATTPKTPRGRAKPTGTPRSTLRKQVTPSCTDSEGEDSAPSPSIRGRKRSRPADKTPSYAESDAESGESEDYEPKKRVKEEPVDDESGGVLGSVFDHADEEEDLLV